MAQGVVAISIMHANAVILVVSALYLLKVLAMPTNTDLTIAELIVEYTAISIMPTVEAVVIHPADPRTQARSMEEFNEKYQEIEDRVTSNNYNPTEILHEMSDLVRVDGYYAYTTGLTVEAYLSEFQHVHRQNSQVRDLYRQAKNLIISSDKFTRRIANARGISMEPVPVTLLEFHIIVLMARSFFHARDRIREELRRNI